MADVQVRGADELARALSRVADQLPELDLSEVVEQIKDVASRDAPRLTGAGVASFSTRTAGGLSSFIVGAPHMVVQEFGSPARGITGKRFVGAPLADQRAGRAAEIAERALSDLFDANNL